MKKYPVGLRPFNSRFTGKGLLAVGIIGLALKTIGFLDSKGFILDISFYFYLVLIIFALYLLLIVSRN